MSRIPEQLVREILEKTDSLGVYQEKVRLTKKGGRWMGLCPFHSERTPSFSVDGDRGLFYCFGCQKGGSVVDFLMELDKIPYREAISELARRAGVGLREETERDSEEEREKQSLFTLYEKLSTTFAWFLLSHPSGSRALEVLRARGISADRIRDFRLGYAPADRRWLYAFLKKKGYSEAFLSRSGLFAASSPGFPLFADRIMFPIADARGKVIAFGGRLLQGEGPKYINSPETAIFRKQENLFALDRAAGGIKESGRILICEGYMDVLSFHEAGVAWAVAPLGTAFTTRQAALLKRRADRVSLCFDADEAGRKAAERGCAIAAAAGLEVDVIRVAGGKDPSEILEKSGPDALKNLPEYTINGGDFLIRRARELFDTGTVEGKAKAAAFLYPYIDALDSEVKRQAFLELASRRLGANPVSMQTDYRAARLGARGTRGRQVSESDGVQPARISAGARTGDLIFMTAVLLSQTDPDTVLGALAPGDLDDSRARDLYLALEEGRKNGLSSTADILALAGDDAARRFVLSVAALGELGDQGPAIVRDGLKSIRIRSLERARLRRIAEIASRADASADELRDDLADVMRIDAELIRLKGETNE